MLVDARAVKLRQPSFIIPNIHNSCAMHARGISSRLPKLFTFQRARDQSRSVLSLQQGRKNPVLYKNRPRRNIISSQKPASMGKRGGYHFFWPFFKICHSCYSNCDCRSPDRPQCLRCDLKRPTSCKHIIYQYDWFSPKVRPWKR